MHQVLLSSGLQLKSLFFLAEITSNYTAFHPPHSPNSPGTTPIHFSDTHSQYLTDNHRPEQIEKTPLRPPPGEQPWYTCAHLFTPEGQGGVRTSPNREPEVLLAVQAKGFWHRSDRKERWREKRRIMIKPCQRKKEGRLADVAKKTGRKQ